MPTESAVNNESEGCFRSRAEFFTALLLCRGQMKQQEGRFMQLKKIQWIMADFLPASSLAGCARFDNESANNSGRKTHRS